MTSYPPQEIQTISAPPQLIIDLLRRSNDPTQFFDPLELYNPDDTTGFDPDKLVNELRDLGVISGFDKSLCLERYTVGRILDALALAGAISALCAYQCALMPTPPDYRPLMAINDAIKQLYHEDPRNLLQGAYLDYQFHLEVVRLSDNRPAYEAYLTAIKPALWLTGANYYTLDDALISIAEHDRMIAIMRRRDSLRARDGAAWHVENAIDHIRRAASAQKQSYPTDTGSS